MSGGPDSKFNVAEIIVLSVIFILVIIGFTIAIIDGDNGNIKRKEPAYPHIQPKIYTEIVEVYDVIYIPAKDAIEKIPERKGRFDSESVDLNLDVRFSYGKVRISESKRYVKILESFAVITIYNGQKLVFQGERNRNLFNVAKKGQNLKLTWIMDHDNAICQKIEFLGQDSKEIK